MIFESATTFRVSAFLLIISFWAPTLTSGQSQPPAIASMCVTCHGESGHNTGPIPSLYSLSPKEFEDRMLGFSTHSAPATVMNGIAKALSDGEIQFLKTFFRLDR